MEVAGISSDPKRWQALAVLGIAFLMVILDVAIVNVALPSIQKDLHFSSASSLQWVVSGYALTYGGLILLGGRLGDILGRRRVFMVGLAAFSIFSLLCGLSTSPTMLIVFRAAAGRCGSDPHAVGLLDHDRHLRGGRRSGTRRSASSAGSPARARRSACCSAASSPSTRAGSGSSSSTSRSASWRWCWCRLFVQREPGDRISPAASTSPGRSRSPAQADAARLRPDARADRRLGVGRGDRARRRLAALLWLPSS